MIDYPSMRPGAKPAATGQPLGTATATTTDRQPGPGPAWQYPTMNGRPAGSLSALPHRQAQHQVHPQQPATMAPPHPPIRLAAAAGDAEPPAAGDDTDTGGTAAAGSVLARNREQLEAHVNRERERGALFTPADVDAEIERRIEAGELARPDGGNGDAGDGE